MMANTRAAALRAAIAEAYATYMAELRQVGGVWEKKPAAGEGEDAWSARQVAEHVAGACGFFGAGIAKAIGAEGPGRTYSELPNAEAAAAHMPGAFDALMGICHMVKDDLLDQEMEFGPLGRASLERVLEVAAYHFNDHAGQLRALRG